MNGKNTSIINRFYFLIVPIDFYYTLLYVFWFACIAVNYADYLYYSHYGIYVNYKTTVLCTKVVLNSKDKKEIKPSTNGTVVTQKEYDDIAVKKMEEMRQMYQGSVNNHGGGMRIGG